MTKAILSQMLMTKRWFASWQLKHWDDQIQILNRNRDSHPPQNSNHERKLQLFPISESNVLTFNHPQTFFRRSTSPSSRRTGIKEENDKPVVSCARYSKWQWARPRLEGRCCSEAGRPVWLRLPSWTPTGPGACSSPPPPPPPPRRASAQEEEEEEGRGGCSATRCPRGSPSSSRRSATATATPPVASPLRSPLGRRKSRVARGETLNWFESGANGVGKSAGARAARVSLQREILTKEQIGLEIGENEIGFGIFLKKMEIYFFLFAKMFKYKF